jgi:hypothetical protein
MTNDTVLLLCGVHSLGFAAFHIGFWRLFGWPKTLESTTLANRAILQIANVLLIGIFLGMAALCLLLPNDILGTPLGHVMLSAMSGFWLVRLALQFVFLRVNHPLVHALSILFALGAVLFALPLFQ